MSDVKFRRSILGAAIMRILRLLVFAHIDTVSGAARRQMIHRIRQRLAVRVRREQRKTSRKALFKLRLHGIVVRPSEILENRDISLEAQRSQFPLTHNHESLGVEAIRVRIQITKGWKLYAAVTDV